jgi:hypothetical protein
MICDIPDNTRKRLDEPIEVQCRRCGAKYFARLFPLRAECGLSEVGDFLEQSETTGLGDIVEKVIDTVTFGMIEKKPSCGCEERKNWLNKFWSWKSRQ